MAYDASVKGYLRGAWDFAAALTKDPKLAFEDFKRGWTESSIHDERLFKPQSVLFGAGCGMAIAGVTVPTSLSVLTVPLGLTLGFLGAGRYHALGEAARIEEEEFDKAMDGLMEGIKAKVESITGEPRDATVEGDVIEGEDIRLPPPKGATPPESHI
jgi:hypothetical protein